jgi:predicted nucleotidyltransferase
MNLEEKFISLIKICVRKNFPEAKIFIFGSRAKETNRKFSDIDIAIKDSKINSQKLAKTRFELEESDLPYKVDLVDYNELDKKILEKAIEL